MSELYENNWVAIGLFMIVAILSVIGVVGYTFNPSVFASFSLVVFSLIISIAGYMVYNIIKIYQEIKNTRKQDKN